MVRLTGAMRKLIDDGLGFFATVNDDGTPNLSPKGTIAVWSDTQVVFADIASPRTSANLEKRPTIAVNVVDPLSRRGCRIRGRGVVHRSGPEFDRIVDFYRRRGTKRAGERIVAAVVVDIEEVSELISPAYALGATEAELRDLHRRRLLDR